MRITAMRRASAAASAAVLAVTLVLGLAGCGGQGDEPDDGGSTSESPGGSTATEKPQDTPTTKDASKPTAHTGKPLPADWPAEVLVPYGEIVFILTNAAGGSSLLIEGVDSEQGKSLIAKMGSAGMKTTGPIDIDARSWTASAENGSYLVTYAYDTGGSSGTPNIGMNVVKKAG